MAVSSREAKKSRLATAQGERLTRIERRAQLLEVAQEIVRREGTDALTLGRLSELAGVSKPIAYEHFGTRAGLLMALSAAVDARQAQELTAALARTPKRLDAIAAVLGRAYMSCYRAFGREWHAITAALAGDAEMASFQQKQLDDYADFYCRALGPYAGLDPEELRLRCRAIIAAGDAIARDMLRGKVKEDAAAHALASLIRSWLRK